MESFDLFLGNFPNLKRAIAAWLPLWEEEEAERSVGKHDAYFMNFSQVVIEAEEWVLITDTSAEMQVAQKRRKLNESLTTDRGKKWMVLSGAEELLQQHEGFYDNLKLQTRFVDPSHAEAEIRKDVCRTNRQEVLWSPENRAEKQAQVYNVLKAYASFFRQIGYCQGMGCVAALLLNELPEEKVFWVMVSLTINARYRLVGLWHPKMPLVAPVFSNMEKLVERHIPDLAEHFANEGVVHCTMYGVCTWFITLFVATRLPLEMIHEIWDVYLAKGTDVIFQVGLGILLNAKEELMERNFEQILQLFGEDIYTRPFPSTFVQDCLKFDIPRVTYDLPESLGNSASELYVRLQKEGRN